MKIKVKAVLRNELVIDEDVNVPDGMGKENAEKYIEETKQVLKDSFRNCTSFYLEFGSTVIRGEDIMAVSMILVEDGE